MKACSAIPGLRSTPTELLRLLAWGLPAGLTALVLPLAVGPLFGTIVPADDRRMFFFIALALFVAIGLRAGFTWLQGNGFARRHASQGRRTERVLWERLFAGPMTGPDERQMASIAGGFREFRQAWTVLGRARISAMNGAILLAGGVTLMFLACPPLAAVAVVLYAAAAAVWVWSVRTLEPEGVSGSAAAFAAGLLRGVFKLRMAGCQDHAFARWEAMRAASNGGGARLRGKRRPVRFGLHHLVPALLAYAVTVAVFLLAEPLRVDHVPEMFRFAAALGVGVAGMNLVTDAFRFRQTTRSRLLPLDALPVVHAAAGTVELCREVPSGAIRVERLRFSHCGAAKPLLEEVSFSIAPGEMVALAGVSGAGKTTLLRLLLGLEEPDSGAIFYDGKSLAEWDVRWLRRQAGTVLQDARMVPGDLFANVCGEHEPNLTRAWRAARLAEVADDIAALPMGWRTVVSPGGFPAGFGQRIALARAFYHEPKLVFLDEATSALDRKKQSAIMTNIRRSRVTRFVIAQRLSTLALADRVLVLHGGRIAEEGAFHELERRGGVFARLLAHPGEAGRP